MSDTFKCENCGGVFGKGLSEEEAQAQYGLEFPDWEWLPEEALGVVCDDCFRIMFPERVQQGGE